MKNTLASLFIALAAIILIACGGGVPSVTSSDAATRCRVEMRGDSITHQAGHVIEQVLPGCEVVNLGVDASILADVVQPVMVFDKDTIYTYSYGTNECMGGRMSVADYKATLNHVAVQGKGYKLVFEAPWRVQHADCRNAMYAYRQAVVDVGRLHGVPVVIENDLSHSGDEVHLTFEHMRARAGLLAAAVKQFL